MDVRTPSSDEEVPTLTKTERKAQKNEEKRQSKAQKAMSMPKAAVKAMKTKKPS